MNSSSVTPATSANVSPITSRSCMPSAEQDLIDPPNSSMINSNVSASNNPNPNANTISAQNSITSVSSSPLPGMQMKEDDYKTLVHSRSQSISQSTTDSPQHQGKNQQNCNLGGQTAEMQLKYENDRLKLALAQSSANAKKWEVSLFLWFLWNPYARDGVLPQDKINKEPRTIHEINLHWNKTIYE